MTLTPTSSTSSAGCSASSARTRSRRCAAEHRRDGPSIDWEAFKAPRSRWSSPALQLPEEYGGSGADLVTQAIAAEELARVVRLDQPHVPHLQARDAAGDQLRLRGAEAEVPARGRERRRARRSYCLSEADAGSRRRGDDDAGRARRRRLRHHRHEVLDHQRRHQRPVHRLRQDRSGRRPPRDHRLPGRGGLGRAGRQARAQAGRAGLAHRRSCCSTRCGCRPPTCIGEEGQGFYIAMHTLDRSRPTIGAQAVGIAQGALDYAVGYMKERKAFGKPIAELRACSSWWPTWP